MSQEFNDMERMFQEGLHNYEVTPPAHVWSNIQKRKRKGLLFYKWRIAAALLLLCIAGTSAYYFTNGNNEDLSSTTISKSTNSNKNTAVAESNAADIKSNVAPNAAENNSTSASNESVNAEVKENEDASGSKYTAKNNTTKNSKTTKTKREKIQRNNVIVNDNDAQIETFTTVDTKDLVMDMKTRNIIKLRYLIYPSLMQFIYSNKRLGKKYFQAKKEDENDKLGFKYSIEIVGGPSYAFRTLKGNGDLLRDESEKGALGTQTGIKVNYHFNPTWSLQTGLIYENRHEIISYNRTEIQDKLTVTSRQVTVFHPVLPSRIITISDSSYSKENVEYKFSSTNKYQTFNIPLVMGYNFGLGKMQYRISAGPLFNIYSINTANNLERNGDNIELVPYKESTKVNTSVYASGALMFTLNQNYNLFTELSYYSNIGNRLNSEAALRQRNYGFGLTGGLKFNIIK